VHGRRFPALQLCDPKRFGRDSMHAQAASQLERWLQDCHGQGSCATIKEGCRSIADSRTSRRIPQQRSGNGARSCGQLSARFTVRIVARAYSKCESIISRGLPNARKLEGAGPQLNQHSGEKAAKRGSESRRTQEARRRLIGRVDSECQVLELQIRAVGVRPGRRHVASLIHRADFGTINVLFRGNVFLALLPI
jgi:hypothetical protein